MQATQNYREVYMRCRAFRGEGIKLNTVRIYDNGEVLVWDSWANHFTSCHTLGRAARERAKRQAT